MSNNHETRETSHGTLETCIEYPVSKIDKLINKFTNSPINYQNAPLQLSRELYKSTLFMQNKAKFSRAQMYVSTSIIKSSKNLMLFGSRKNKPKQTQNEPNFSSILASFFPKLALFSPKLASFHNEIFAFAKKLNLFADLVKRTRIVFLWTRKIFTGFNNFADLQGKNAKHSCGRRIYCMNSLLFKAKNPENTQVSEINPCQSVKSVVKLFVSFRVYSWLNFSSLKSVAKFNFVNPVILFEKNQFKILVNRLKIWYNSCRTWNQPARSEILTQKERKIKGLL